MGTGWLVAKGSSLVFMCLCICGQCACMHWLVHTCGSGRRHGRNARLDKGIMHGGGQSAWVRAGVQEWERERIECGPACAHGCNSLCCQDSRGVRVHLVVIFAG